MVILFDCWIMYVFVYWSVGTRYSVIFKRMLFFRICVIFICILKPVFVMFWLIGLYVYGDDFTISPGTADAK